MEKVTSKTILKNEKTATGSDDIGKEDRLLELGKRSAAGKYRVFLNSRSAGMAGSEDTGDTGKALHGQKAAPNPATTGNLTQCSKWRVTGSEPSLRKVDPFTWT